MEAYFMNTVVELNPFEVSLWGDIDIIRVQKFPIDNNMCHLDEGGPLYIFHCGTIVPLCLYGIMSHSEPLVDFPRERCNGRDVFMNIPVFAGWIEKTIRNHNY